MNTLKKDKNDVTVNELKKRMTQVDFNRDIPVY